MRCENCNKEFQRNSAHQRFCSDPCRYQSGRRTNPPKPRKSLRCKWCRGAHQTNLCPNRGPAIRQFGTLDQDRNYIPPPGVKVRILSIPRTVDGEQLKAILKETP